VAWGNNRFVVVGQEGGAANVVLTSEDGSNWTRQTVPTAPALVDVAYGGGHFVAVGSSGVILVSADGTQWTDRSVSTTVAFTGVTYGNGLFVAVGAAWISRALLRISADGMNWAESEPVMTALKDVTYGNGVFVASGLGNALVVSLDGRQWSSVGSLPSQSALGFGGGRFLAVANSGVILQSGTIGARLAPLGKPGPTGFAFTVLGEPNTRYQMDYTSDFVAWTKLAEVAGDLDGATVLDTAAQSAPRRFYRATVLGAD
jgi:hypothetical protein